jgi:hypothetical protein
VRIVIRLAAAALLAGVGYVHTDLYLHGYRAIPAVGPMFLLLASGSFAVAVLLLAAESLVPRLLAIGLAGGALIGFLLSRTVGVFGFVEHGWQPVPDAVLSIVFEFGVLGLIGVGLWRLVLTGRATPAPASPRTPG